MKKRGKMFVVLNDYNNSMVDLTDFKRMWFSPGTMSAYYLSIEKENHEIEKYMYSSFMDDRNEILKDDMKKIKEIIYQNENVQIL